MRKYYISQGEQNRKMTLIHSATFRNIFEQSPIGMDVYNIDGDLLMNNKACIKMFGGLDKEDMKGYNLFLETNYSDKIKEALRKGEHVRVECEYDFDKIREQNIYKTVKKGISILDWIIIPLLNRKQEIIGYIDQIQDITNQRKSENDLKKLNIELEKLVLDRTQLLEEKNINLEETNAMLEQEIAVRQRIEEDIKTVNDELENTVVERTYQLVEMNASLEEEITERKIAEEMLKESELEYKNLYLEFQQKQALLVSLINSIPDLIFYKNRDSVYLGCNKAFEAFAGKSENKLTGLTDFEIFDKEVGEFFRAMDIEMMKEGKARRNEEMVQYPDGTQVMLDTLKTPYYDPQGNVLGLIGISRDITQKIEAEAKEQLLKLERAKNEMLEREIAMKDEFLSLLSHEFRTPLTVINSAIQAMELICKNELSDKSKGFLNKIKQNSNRQLKLINNLLDITRMNAGHLKINKTNLDIVRFTKLITESLIIFAEQKCIKLSFSSTLGKKIIGVDDEKYERILLNLLSNAIKFTPEGQSIIVKISQKIVKGKCMVCIQVRDNGVGIPVDKKKLIFERFGQVDTSLTRQAEGTGIGLHLVKLFLEMMGGEITLESKVGKGSTFTIILPIEKAKEALSEQTKKEMPDQRLIRSASVEFSDIYI